MLRFGVVMVAFLSPWGGALAASVINLDTEPRSITVTEDGNTAEYVIAPGKSVELCPVGCFVKMPDGKHEVLAGFETIEIFGGVGRIR